MACYQVRPKRIVRTVSRRRKNIREGICPFHWIGERQNTYSLNSCFQKPELSKTNQLQKNRVFTKIAAFKKAMITKS